MKTLKFDGYGFESQFLICSPMTLGKLFNLNAGLSKVGVVQEQLESILSSIVF